MADYYKKDSEFKERLVSINRITKVVKGGRRFGFAALVVVGNLKGSIGIVQGKSKQVPDAIKKATEVAKRSLIKIPLKEGRTLHHDVNGKNGSGKVILRTAPSGTGIIAGGPIRAVCEVLGIQDIVAKSLGSSNPHNVLKACVKGLLTQSSPKLLASIRGKKISDIIIKRETK
jgi:small subunit ribosomal protein S5